MAKQGKKVETTVQMFLVSIDHIVLLHIGLYVLRTKG